MFKSDATRELRAKNPLGVSLSSTYSWDGIDLSFPGVAGSDGVLIPGVDNKLNDHLVVFLTFQDGLNAAAWLLHDSYFAQGFNTPASIGNRWAGDKTGSYGQSIAKLMGRDPNAILDYQTDLPALMLALAIEENGHGDVEDLPEQQLASAQRYGGMTDGSA